MYGNEWNIIEPVSTDSGDVRLNIHDCVSPAFFIENNLGTDQYKGGTGSY
jgi:hypothetical protein